MPRPSTVVLILTALLSLASGSFSTVTDDHLRSIPSPNDDFNIKEGKLLAPILIPRVPGTDGSYKVQKHFVDFFENELPEWRRISQNSTSKTPVTGDRDVPFTNWIFQRDPPWAREGDVGRLTLVAHFDSLIKPEGFIGAIDSAAPCAMLMHVARSIDDALTSKWKEMEDSGDAGLEEAKGIQIIFLDGEEAFERWSDDDSLYGARSLAAEWERTPHESMSTYKTPLDSISLFVLLDLLGAEGPTVPSYFLPTHWAYRNMADLEKRMRDLKLLESSPKQPFLPDGDKEATTFGRGFIGDDHVPFMQRGVEILHLIPSPFPRDLWHKMEDDGEHLDLGTCRDWSRIVTAFTMEWLEIGDYMPKKVAREEGSKSGVEKGKRTEL
ncbi:peptidase family M28-domain-containing protein [Emericellopsis atlantica]|uniref:Peptide hydrolase n=1 Tax=Emericellopsis atlantica TaxID=2614577 RepID=A0A9P7ZV03_9HYPO|nr:peptidase family M28-domain-containing protein [Emericellopsis atlantica]KAG9258257.1 peptidase family M28-domain-containing protein [Emericellopsis atlantica]